MQNCPYNGNKTAHMPIKYICMTILSYNISRPSGSYDEHIAFVISGKG